MKTRTNLGVNQGLDPSVLLTFPFTGGLLSHSRNHSFTGSAGLSHPPSHQPHYRGGSPLLQHNSGPATMLVFCGGVTVI